MNKLLVAVVGLVVLIPLMVTDGYSLGEFGGKFIFNILPGQTKTLTWGIVSDINATTSLKISAIGNGTQFLSFPSSAQLAPKGSVNVSVNATIPANYAQGETFTAMLVAVQQGAASGGQETINLAVLKTVTIVIGNQTGTTTTPQAPATQPVTNKTSPSVPEFGPISVLVLILAISLTILMTKRRLGFFV